MHTLPTSRLLAGFGTLALLGGIGFAASRPAHTAGGPIAVTVANSPLSTTPTDNPVKQGVQFSVNVLIPIGSTGSNILGYTVPTGKRLVIESVNSSTNDFGDANHYSLFYQAYGGLGSALGFGYFNELPDGSPYSVGVSHTQLYAEAGQKIYLQVDRTENTGKASVNVSFTGYLVDIATPGGSS